MNKYSRITQVMAFAFLFPIFSGVVFGCSLIVFPPLPIGAVHAENTVIFVGEVVGRTAKIEDKKAFRGKARGLRLKIVESINSPASRNGFVDFFYFPHGSDCFLEGRESDKPIGTRLLVIGEDRNRNFQSYPSLGRHILSSKVWGMQQVVSRNFSLFASSDFDYVKNRKSLGKNKIAGEQIGFEWSELIAIARDSKELNQLSRNSTRRKEILERMSKYSFFDFPSFINKRLSNDKFLILNGKCLFQDSSNPRLRHCDAGERVNEWEARLIKSWEKIERVRRKLIIAPDARKNRGNR